MATRLPLANEIRILAFERKLQELVVCLWLSAKETSNGPGRGGFITLGPRVKLAWSTVTGDPPLTSVWFGGKLLLSSAGQPIIQHNQAS